MESVINANTTITPTPPFEMTRFRRPRTKQPPPSSAFATKRPKRARNKSQLPQCPRNEIDEMRLDKVIYSEGGSLTLGKRFGILAKATSSTASTPTSTRRRWPATPTYIQGMLQRPKKNVVRSNDVLDHVIFDQIDPTSRSY